MLLQRNNHHRLEIKLSIDIFKAHLNKCHLKGEAEEALQMQGEDERREDNTAGEEETTFTTSTQVSCNIILAKFWSG